MHIYAHRGFWRTADERNGIEALRRAFEHGFGVETDVRDLDGRLVISHDPPTLGALDFEEVLDCYLTCGAPGKLALNIKADGLAKSLKQALDQACIANYAVFDMSVPDLLCYRAAGMPFYVRRSEFEGTSSLDADSVGVWLDAFQHPYADANAIGEGAAAVNGDLALVSPELHRRPHEQAWALWKAMDLEYPGRMWLCTDFPDRAKSYFQVAD